MNWQIDGVDNNDFWHNIPAVNQGGVSGIAGVVLPIDSIEEFSSQTQSGAEAGRNAGGTVNLDYQVCGNTASRIRLLLQPQRILQREIALLHSVARHEGAAAAQPKLRVSGKRSIRKDKAFYLVSFEKQQYIIGLSGVATEPSDAWVTAALNQLSAAGIPESSVSKTLIGPTGFWPRSGSGSIAGLGAVPNNFFSPIASIGP